MHNESYEEYIIATIFEQHWTKTYSDNKDKQRVLDTLSSLIKDNSVIASAFIAPFIAPPIPYPPPTH